MPNWQRTQWSLQKGVRLVNPLARGIRKPHTSQNEDNKANQCRVAHVEHCTRQAAEADAGGPEDEGIQEDVATSHTRTGKGTPVPPVVLGAKQEVYKQDSGGCRSDDHQTVAQEQESKHVVNLVGPERGHDEV